MRIIAITAFLVLLMLVMRACSSELPNDLPSLVVLMASNDMKVHTDAAHKVQAVYGVDGLLKALDSQLPGAKVQAARFLRLNPNPRARDPLLKATRHNDTYVRAWASFALSSVPDPEVEARLYELLSDPQPVVQSYAKQALNLIEEGKKMR